MDKDFNYNGQNYENEHEEMVEEENIPHGAHIRPNNPTMDATISSSSYSSYDL